LSEPTLDEVMAVAMARQIHDRDFVSHGASVPLAAAALMLAIETHAPNAEFFYQGTISTEERDPAKLMLDIEGIYRSAPAFFSQAQVIDFELRGHGDFQYLRPAQIDRFGSVNTSVIGTLEAPRYRFHGIAVADAMTVVRRVCLYVTEHTPRVFVEQLAFTTGLGNVGGGAWRERIDAPGGGPCAVITPLAILDFAGPGRTMRLAELLPSATIDDVLAATGFELAIAPNVTSMSPPTPVELETLRRLDPLETRKLEFREWRAAARARLADRR
jgi:glutaconate CoA-transferase subunit B